MATIGSRLREAREEAGYSLRQAADEISELLEDREVIRYGALSKYEREESAVRADVLLAACQLYGAHPVWVLTGDGTRGWDQSGAVRRDMRVAATWMRRLAKWLDRKAEEEPLPEDREVGLHPFAEEPVAEEEPENGGEGAQGA